jgi:CubicO group peptidase (beta-lactamase class C family)
VPCHSLPLLFLACSTALAQPRDTAGTYPGAEWTRWASPEAAGFDADRLEELRDYVSTLSTTGLMVVRGGQSAFEYGDLDTLSYVASVRKSVLAMLYGRYVADGTIDLGRTLANLGMDDVLGLTESERGATVWDLVTARSGVYHPAANAGDDSDEAPPRGAHPPGAYFLYNNWDFNAAGAAFERMTGRDLYDAFETDLAGPIGMERWYRFVHRKQPNDERSRYPAFYFVLSTRDMARLGLLMSREGRWGDRQVIPAEWARTIVRAETPVGELNPVRLRSGEVGYGVMWWVYDGAAATGPFEGAYRADGFGGQYLTVLPALDVVVAHKTVVDSGGEVTPAEHREILGRVVAAYCGTDCE